MANDELGQVFTPEEICDLMVSKLPADLDSRILEPCFGAGAFLAALEKAKYSNVIGFEIDNDLFARVSRHCAYQCVCADFLGAQINEKFDGIIMNPPYIRHEAFANLQKYGINIKALRKCPPFNSLPARSNLYAYFIAKCFSLLSAHGIIVAIIPSTWTSQNSYLSDYIERMGGQIEKIPLDGLPFGKDILTSADIVIIRKRPGLIKINGERQKNKIPAKHVLAHSLCKIKRGLTTGMNRFFVNNKELLDFSEPILSNPRSIELFMVDKHPTDLVAILPEGIDSLAILNKEREILASKKPASLVNKIQAGGCWYHLKPIFSRKGSLIFPYIIRDKMRFIWCQEKIIIRDNFYLIDSEDPYLFMALFNNYYIYDQLELVGKNYGGGMLKIQAYDLKNLCLINPIDLTKTDKDLLRELGKRLAESKNAREAYAILDEISCYLSSWEKISSDEIKTIFQTHRQKRLEMRYE